MNEEALIESLRCVANVGTDVTVTSVEDLSRGFTYAQVFRVTLEQAGRAWRSAIVKLPNTATMSIIGRTDALREERFVRSFLWERVQVYGLVVPSVLGIDDRHRWPWLWFEDVSLDLAVDWSRREQPIAAAGNANLHRVYREAQGEIEKLKWLARDEHAAHAAQIPVAHDNLRAACARLPDLFSSDETRRLHALLDDLEWSSSELAALPHTLTHGDFHIGNLGLRRDALVAIDWGNVGLGAIGSDIGTFISVYRLFGGSDGEYGSGFDDRVVDAYDAAITALTGRPLRQEISRAVGIWHMTWGLHLRLGKALTAVLSNHIPDPERVARVLLDVQEGCARALAFAGREGRA